MVFSFIIPTYNRASLITKAICSILEQGYTSLEIIIIDDGSTDNTQDIILELNDDRIRYVKLPENKERGYSRNFGARLAKGRYINFFDSDDELNPCLLQVDNFIIAHNFPSIVFGSIEIISESRKSKGIVKKNYSDFKRSLISNNFLACGAVFLKNDLAARFPFLEDRRLSGTEDWELWLRLYSTHEFVDCSIIIFKQLDHPQRSLNVIDREKIIEREFCFKEVISVQSELLLRRFIRSDIDLLLADRYTFIALMQIEGGNVKGAFNNLRKAFLLAKNVLYRRRFWAVVKKIVF